MFLFLQVVALTLIGAAEHVRRYISANKMVVGETRNKEPV